MDVQGLRGKDNEFIYKEVAVVLPSREFYTFIIKPPYPVTNLTAKEYRQVRWLQNNYHGINWSDGITPLDVVHRFLIETLPSNSVVYVKGAEKTTWVSHLLNNSLPVWNVEDLGCESFSVLRNSVNPNSVIRCTSHWGYCALENVFLIKHFVFKSQ